MSTAIPTSASISESAVISAPLSQVWHLIKLQDFHKFWSKLEKSEHEKGTSPETDIVKWTFKDGTVLDVKQEEHSVGDPASLLNKDRLYSLHSNSPYNCLQYPKPIIVYQTLPRN